MRIILVIVIVSFYLLKTIDSRSLGAAEKERLIKELTLYHGNMTNGRSVDPIPQLKCVGGSAGCNAFIPQTVRCYHSGWNNVTGTQWECKAEKMPNTLDFGKINVNCEGYANRSDPYVLKGSCGLEYTIELRNQRFQPISQPTSNAISGTGKSSNPDVLLLIVLLACGISACYL